MRHEQFEQQAQSTEATALSAQAGLGSQSLSDVRAAISAQYGSSQIDSLPSLEIGGGTEVAARYIVNRDGTVTFIPSRPTPQPVAPQPTPRR